MKYSNILGKTLKEAPRDEEAINAKLLIRAGYIDKLMAGSYSLLHLGRRTQQKIEGIIREEMNAIGCEEILMPLMHPKDIWNETGRWDHADEVMYKLEHSGRDFALSFTHEEIFLDLIRKHIRSYRDLPIASYQFSTKFRSELRAKSGILRGREFVMKDLYSVHTDKADFEEFYEKVAETYMKIFARMGLNVKRVEAGGGVFTESHTHEFQLPCATGEDTIFMKDDWEYAKNLEIMTDEEINDPEVKSEKAIEVGNIFPFGTTYSEKMNVNYIDADGARKPVYFGSYGIGVTRMIGVIVEVSHDDRGIIWPHSVAPYSAHLIGVGENDSQALKKTEEIYEQLKKEGVEVLWDDRRDATTGAKFADSDLVGLPSRVVISAKTLEKGEAEIKSRQDGSIEMVPIDKLDESLKALN